MKELHFPGKQTECEEMQRKLWDFGGGFEGVFKAEFVGFKGWNY